MEPTLQIGDHVIVNKLAYQNHSIRAGDIVVFHEPAAEDCGGAPVAYLVKRVIGLPGETISLTGGYVDIDGKRLDESWLPSSEQGTTFPGPVGPEYNLASPYKIPGGNYFVLGDNRGDSCDSRFWGPITKSLIVGKVTSVEKATTVAVPNVYGLSMSAADAALAQAGLDGESGSFDQSCANGASPDEIDNTSPNVGASVPIGSVVTVYPCE
jgi:signal peptidase I